MNLLRARSALSRSKGAARTFACGSLSSILRSRAFFSVSSRSLIQAPDFSMDELALLKRRSTFHRLHQRRNLDGREIGEGVRHRVWQNDLVVVPHRPAGIDDVRDVSLALRRLGPQQRLAGAGKHLRGVVLVEQ